MQFLKVPHQNERTVRRCLRRASGSPLVPPVPPGTFFEASGSSFGPSGASFGASGASFWASGASFRASGASFRPPEIHIQNRIFVDVNLSHIPAMP